MSAVDLDIFALPLHPSCAVWPMLDDDELADLAEDIRLHGLRVPIVVGQHEGRTVLIDGKNRRAACQMVGVVPDVRELDPGEDPVAFIWSANDMRIHHSKGQKAMMLAMTYPNPPRGRGRQDPACRKGAENKSLSYRRVKEARFVLRYLPDLAALVLSGAAQLDEAVTKAGHAKEAAERHERAMTRLKNWRPTLADAVTAGTLSLEAALAAAADSDEQERRARHALAKRLVDVTELPALFANEDTVAEILALLNEHPDQFEKSAEISVAAFIRFLLEDAKRYGETLRRSRERDD